MFKKIATINLGSSRSMPDKSPIQRKPILNQSTSVFVR